jgi:hypothetical protein
VFNTKLLAMAEGAINRRIDSPTTKVATVIFLFIF